MKQENPRTFTNTKTNSTIPNFQHFNRNKKIAVSRRRKFQIHVP